VSVTDDRVLASITFDPADEDAVELARTMFTYATQQRGLAAYRLSPEASLLEVAENFHPRQGWYGFDWPPSGTVPTNEWFPNTRIPRHEA
jgi:hypothetical protein